MSLDPAGLERILAPWAAARSGPAIAVEDETGRPIAGTSAPHGHRIAADVTFGDAVVARVVATGVDPSDAGVAAVVRAAVASLAAAVTALVAEERARRDVLQALSDHREADIAGSLGIDPVELAKGRRQQRSIVSLTAPEVPGYDLASHYAAAREIGGDFFELFRLRRRGHPLAFSIADVTGKGLDAALLMAFARPVLHSALEAAPGPAEALERTNRVLVGERRGTLFITALCGRLEPGSGRLRLAAAGHEPPWLIPGDGGPIGPVGDAGLLLGAFATVAAPEARLTLAPGDVLFCYTDGATDTRDPAGERFGDDRLLGAVGAARGGSAHEIVTAVRAAVEAFQGTAEAADDLTLLAIGRTRSPAPRRRRRPADQSTVG